MSYVEKEIDGYQKFKLPKYKKFKIRKRKVSEER